MHRNQTSKYLTITLLSLCLAILLRLIGSKSIPVNMIEIQLFNETLLISTHKLPVTLHNPAYSGLTAPLFYFLPSSIGVGRLWGFVLSISLVFLPFIYREQISFRTHILLSFLLAADPLLVYAGIDAAYPMLAIAFYVWLVVALQKKWKHLFGLFFALGLLAGKFFWVLLLLTGIYLVLVMRKDTGQNRSLFFAFLKDRFDFLKGSAATFGISLICIATAFLLYPSGIGNLGTGLVQLFQFQISGGQALERLLYLARLSYSLPYLFLLLYTSFAFIRGNKQLDFPGIIVAYITLVLSAIFPLEPGFQLLFIFFAVYVSLPLIQDLLSRFQPNFNAGVLTFFLLAISVYITIQIHNLGWQNQYFGLTLPSLIGLIAGLVLFILAVALVQIGWGKRTAQNGVLAAVLILIPILTIAATFTIIGPHAIHRSQVFSQDPVVDPDNTIGDLLRFIDQRAGIAPFEQRLVNLSKQTSAVDWVFRNYDQSSELPNPDLVLTELDEQPDESEAYNGMEIAITKHIALDPNYTPFRNFINILKGNIVMKEARVKLWISPHLIFGNLP